MSRTIQAFQRITPLIWQWHNVTNQDANKGVAQKIAQTKGLTTLAPTWVHVADTSGNITSIASSDYVSYAHQQNIEVWMTVRDFDEESVQNRNLTNCLVIHQDVKR